MAYIRVDLLRAKPGSLDKMMKAGFKGMHFGIESLSLETSKSIGKGFTGEPLKAYLREIKNKYPKLNITSSFIIGLPNESYEQAAANIREVVAEKLVDSAPLYPLGIPKKAEMHTDLSEFSLTWDKHGYEELTVEEAEKLLELHKYSMFKGINLEVRSFSEVIWKNAHMNVFDAWLYTSKLKQEVHSSTNISGWHCFAASSDDTTVDQRLNYTRPEWDWNSVKQSTEEFVQNYKRNKMAVFNN
jgi:histone acetyltransferase (RNA polymerase elongator complex component)